MENQPEKKMTINESVSIIDQMFYECGVMGANDYELPTLMDLKEQVKDGRISPEEAAKAAEQIRYSKQDYH